MNPVRDKSVNNLQEVSFHPFSKSSIKYLNVLLAANDLEVFAHELYFVRVVGL